MTVYYQSMTGEDFELDVRDGNNKNASLLKLVNESTGVNEAVMPSSSSGHELYIRFRYRAGYWKTVRVKFLITHDRGRKFWYSIIVLLIYNYGKT